MGLESANYKFSAKRISRDDVILFLEEIGAVAKTCAGGDFLSFVLSANEYLIDFQIFPENKKSYLTLSIRIALCNSDAVIPELISILSKLTDRFHGSVFDQNSKSTFSTLGDSEKNQIRDAFLKRKSEFQKWYGNFTAAISGEKVFEYMRSLKK